MEGSTTPTTRSYSGMYDTLAMDKLAAHEDDSTHHHSIEDLSGPDHSEGSFSGGNLSGGNLSGGNLSGGNLPGGNLSGGGTRLIGNGTSSGDRNGDRDFSSDTAYEPERAIRRPISRSSSVVSHHRFRLPSSDSLSKAEGHFLTLVDFLSSASREASSLQGFWSTVTAERNSIIEERNELYERIVTLGEQCEDHKQQRRKQERELAERQRLIDKLRLSLATATANEANEKKHHLEAKEEVKRLRQKLYESDRRYTNLQADRQSLATELETTQSRLRTVEEERDAARRHHHEHDHRHRDVVHERDELRTRFDEVVNQHEASKREISVLKQRLATSESERLSYMKRCEKAALEEKKLRLQIEEISKQILEITERHRSSQKDIKRYQETISKFEQEKGELNITIEQLRRDLKIANTARAKLEEERTGDAVHHDRLLQDIATLKERITMLEEERTSMTATMDQLKSQHRVVLVERNKLTDELRSWQSQHEDSQQRILSLRDEMSKLQSSLSQLRAERSSLLERVERAERQLEDYRHHQKESETETIQYKRRISTLESDLQTMTGLRDTLQVELNELRSTYEDSDRTCVQLREDVAAMDHDLEHLRAQLREAYEQRDRAIASRGSADRERDEYIKKYEEKCRQLERGHTERPNSPIGHHHPHHHHSAYERIFGPMRNHFATGGYEGSMYSESRVVSGSRYGEETMSEA